MHHNSRFALARILHSAQRLFQPTRVSRDRVRIVDSPTERTTAATDAILSALAIGSALWIHRQHQRHPWKVTLWSTAYGTLATGAALGAIAHGLQISPRTRECIWRPLNLSLGTTIALFVTSVVYDTWNEQTSRRVLPITLASAGAFSVITIIRPGSYLLLVLYQSVGMLFALAAYSRLAWKQQLPGAELMTAGILITIIASAIQATERAHLHLIWEFDHNGIYHLVQMAGLVTLLAGVQQSLQEEPT